MNQEQLNQAIRLLQKRRDAIFSLRGSERDNALLKSGMKATGDVGDTDTGADLAEQDVALTLTKLESVELSNIDAAITRAHEGRYGICEVCGQQIPTDRLMSIPEAACCLTCELNLKEPPTNEH